MITIVRNPLIEGKRMERREHLGDKARDGHIRDDVYSQRDSADQRSYYLLDVRHHCVPPGEDRAKGPPGAEPVYRDSRIVHAA